MAESGNGNSGGNGNTGDNKQFALQKVYLKDLSLEAPNSPGLFMENPVEPEIQLNISNKNQQLKDNVYEVVLHIAAHAKSEERTVFLVELDQAGIFEIRGYSEEEKQRLMGTYCLTSLFPYAREAVSTLIGKGGFPALLLQPINFDALYAQAVSQQQNTS